MHAAHVWLQGIAAMAGVVGCGNGRCGGVRQPFTNHPRMLRNALVAHVCGLGPTRGMWQVACWGSADGRVTVSHAYR